MTGIVYLVQPCELVGTNRYKIGCSNKPTLDRVKSYKNGTRFILIMECKFPRKVESKIISEFNQKFKLIAGKEYYEGDENEMRELFYDTFNENLDTKRLMIDTSSFVIDTYQKYIDYGIDTFDWNKDMCLEIIITNKNRKIGYWKLHKNNPWEKIDLDLYEIISESSFIKNYVYIYNNKILTSENYNEISRNKNYNINLCSLIPINYNFELIIKDICNKCYVKNPNIKEFNYYEYLIDICFNPGDFKNIEEEGDYFVLNSKENELYELNYFPSIILDNSYSYITEKSGTYENEYDDFDEVLYIMNVPVSSYKEINVSYVQFILESIVNKEIVKEYKKFCYHLLVEPNFINLFDDNECGYLTMFVTDLLDNIGRGIEYIEINEDTTITKVKKYIIENSRIRLAVVYFDEVDENELNKILGCIKSNNIRSVITVSKKIKNYYTDIAEDENFIELIGKYKELFKFHMGKLYSWDDTTKIDIFTIFSVGSYLAPHFMKWCCLKSV